MNGSPRRPSPPPTPASISVMTIAKHRGWMRHRGCLIGYHHWMLKHVGPPRNDYQMGGEERDTR